MNKTDSKAPDARAWDLDVPEPVEVADIDGDGLLDVVTAHGGWDNLGVYLQQPDGTLGDEQLSPIPSASHYDPHGLALGDVTGDHGPDALIADYNNGLVFLENTTSETPVPPDNDDLADAEVIAEPDIFDGFRDFDTTYEMTEAGKTAPEGSRGFAVVGVPRAGVGGSGIHRCRL